VRKRERDQEGEREKETVRKRERDREEGERVHFLFHFLLYVSGHPEESAVSHVDICHIDRRQGLSLLTERKIQRGTRGIECSPACTHTRQGIHSNHGEREREKKKKKKTEKTREKKREKRERGAWRDDTCVSDSAECEEAHGECDGIGSCVTVDILHCTLLLHTDAVTRGQRAEEGRDILTLLQNVPRSQIHTRTTACTVCM
jgi:hypothetical protein